MTLYASLFCVFLHDATYVMLQVSIFLCVHIHVMLCVTLYLWLPVMLFIVRDVDGHRVVTQRLHLVHRQIFVRVLADHIFVA